MAHVAVSDLSAVSQVTQPAQLAAGDLSGCVEAAQSQRSLRAAIGCDETGHDQVQRVAELGFGKAAVKLRFLTDRGNAAIGGRFGPQLSGGLERRCDQSAAFLTIREIRQSPGAERVEKIASARRAGAGQFVPPTEGLRGFTVEQEEAELVIEPLVREPVQPSCQSLVTLGGVVDDEKCSALPFKAVSRQGIDYRGQISRREKAGDPLAFGPELAVDRPTELQSKPGLAGPCPADQTVNRDVDLVI
jgi:hypothetical protein